MGSKSLVWYKTESYFSAVSDVSVRATPLHNCICVRTIWIQQGDFTENRISKAEHLEDLTCCRSPAMLQSPQEILCTDISNPKPLCETQKDPSQGLWMSVDLWLPGEIMLILQAPGVWLLGSSNRRGEGEGKDNSSWNITHGKLFLGKGLEFATNPVKLFSLLITRQLLLHVISKGKKPKSQH